MGERVGVRGGKAFHALRVGQRTMRNSLEKREISITKTMITKAFDYDLVDG